MYQKWQYPSIFYFSSQYFIPGIFRLDSYMVFTFTSHMLLSTEWTRLIIIEANSLQRLSVLYYMYIYIAVRSCPPTIFGGRTRLGLFVERPVDLGSWGTPPQRCIFFFFLLLKYEKRTKSLILIHYVCNAHFHWLWRRKFAALKS